MVADKRVREAMSIAINRAEIAKAILLGNADPAFTFVDTDALDFDPKTKGIVKEDLERAKKLLDEAGWKPGADGMREKDGMKLAPQGLLHRQRQLGRASPRRSRAICGRSASTGSLQPVGLDHRVGEDGRAGLRDLVGDGALSVGRRPHEHLLRFGATSRRPTG